MPDDARRAAILERSKALRMRAADFVSRLTDDRAREFLRTTVLNSLDDVDGFFLGDRKGPTGAWETMWLDTTEMILSAAERSFERFESLAEKYGGPSNVRIVG